MMCTWAIGAVEVLEPSDGVLTRAGWKLANMGYFRSMEHVNQPDDQLAKLRAREQRVVALIARTVQGDQTALAELYDETNTLVYSLALRILDEQFAAEDVTIEVYTQVRCALYLFWTLLVKSKTRGTAVLPTTFAGQRHRGHVSGDRDSQGVGD